MIKFVIGLVAGIFSGLIASLCGASLPVAATIGIIVAIIAWGGWVLFVDGDWNLFD